MNKIFEVLQFLNQVWVYAVVAVLVGLVLLIKPTRDQAIGYFQKLEWLCREVLAMFSNKPSYFSMKRFFTWTGFVMGQYYVYSYWNENIHSLSYEHFIGIILIEFFIGGYVLDKVIKGTATDKDLQSPADGQPVTDGVAANAIVDSTTAGNNPPTQ